MIGRERYGQLERRHLLAAFGGRGVDRLLHRFEVVVADGQVDGFLPDADGDLRLFAQHSARRFLLFRNGHGDRVEVDARVTGGVPLDFGTRESSLFWRPRPVS